MTTRTLPEIPVIDRPDSLDWDAPITARESWQPVKAKVGDPNRTLTIDQPIGDRGDGTGITTGYVRGALNRMGQGDVTVNINSPGGDFFTGVAVYNMLREHAGIVTTNVLGMAASAASVIAFASDHLRVAKAGFLMIHNSQGLAMGNRNDMRATADILEQFDSAMASVYADRSGIALPTIKKYMDAETIFRGEQAVKNGMADSLLASDQLAPTTEPAPVAAYRRLDDELTRLGLPRAERRALLSAVINGEDTPRAILAPNGTPRAADLEMLAIFGEISSIVSK